MRKLASVIVSAGLLVSLSACATTPSLFADCGPSGNAALVTAEGAFGADPAAEFPTPLVATTPETAQVRPGDGDPVPAGGVVDGLVSLYLGDTGEAVESSSGPLVGAPLFTPTVDGPYPFSESLQCANVGARVVTTGTVQELFGPDFGLDPALTIVVVTDITAAYLGKANGVDQISESGVPAIVLAPNGQPGFTFPDGDPPTDLRISVLKLGSGDVVEQGDSVVVHYTGILWDGTAPFDSSWTNDTSPNTPATLVAESLEDAESGGLVPGFAEALIGQTVGSQVLVVIPPEFGYPAGAAPASIPEGSTMVFVFDVLGIVE